MWETIHTNDEILKFMESVCHFHDSCIKEISYISGAYVSENHSMHPLNGRRVLRVVIQRQYEKDSMIEMEFQGLKHLKLFPVDESYTCEILDSTMIMKDGNFYWCDCGNVSESDLDDYAGTLICASGFLSRIIWGIRRSIILRIRANEHTPYQQASSFCGYCCCRGRCTVNCRCNNGRLDKCRFRFDLDTSG